MALKHQNRGITEQEYLEGELLSDIRHEYIDGQVYAMAGGSSNHNRIAATLTRMFGNHLENSPCEVMTSDMKVKSGTKFFYPDVIVMCHNENQDSYYTESPVIIVEVLSKTTRKADRTFKKLAYQSLPSLQEYVLIEQDFVDVEICRRANHWQSEHYFLGDEAYFASIDLRLPVEAIYARVANDDMREFLAARETGQSPSP
jgi:Uma2 family endonuclease